MSEIPVGKCMVDRRDGSDAKARADEAYRGLSACQSSTTFPSFNLPEETVQIALSDID